MFFIISYMFLYFFMTLYMCVSKVTQQFLRESKELYGIDYTNWDQILVETFQYLVLEIFF